MARARNIKPSIFKNELLGEADPLLTILFEGLWCLADRAGRLEDRPKRIKAEIFPYREIPDINGYLTELERLGFIQRYAVGSSRFIQVKNFLKHQSPHRTEKASEIPEPPEKSDGCLVTGKPPLNNESVPVKESLIPDSLIPDSSDMSGEPDPGPPEGEKPKNAELKKQATEILQFLNMKTGRNYQPVNGTLKPLVARLKEGFTVSECRKVIAKKCRDWGKDDKMEQYLRPKTLFAQENFSNYIGELVEVTNE
jgi:uncharacterized phage protein (TIGR02220 family)